MTPLKCAVISSGLNIVLDALLVRPLAHGGLALATSLVATVNTVLLFRALRRKMELSGGEEFLRSLAKVVFAAVIMGMAISFIASYLGQGNMSHQTVKVGLCLFAGGIVYVTVCKALGLEEIGKVMHPLTRLKRKR